MIALDSANHPAAQVFDVGDAFHQLRLGIGHEQVSPRKRAVVLVAEHIEQMVEAARNVELRGDVLALADQGQRLAIE
ncbi:hypothetical protein D3C80_1717150 [compost metagenome]